MACFIMARTTVPYGLLLLLSLVLPSHCITQRIFLSRGAIQGLQVDSQGRAYIATDEQIFKLSRDLVLQQSINLSSSAVGISLSSCGEWLVVCTRISCTVYNTSDLNDVGINSTNMEVGISDHVAVFTAGSTYYVGSLTLPVSGDDSEISLIQYDYQRSDTLRFQKIIATEIDFNRTIFGGFSSGGYAYFIVLDRIPSGYNGFRIMRVCHVTSCAGSCFFNALYEEEFTCGDPVSNNENDKICGVSLVEDFAGLSEPSIVVSRCHPQGVFSNNNRVCVIKVTDVDRIMERRYNECLAGRGVIAPAWSQDSLSCSESGNFQPLGYCHLNLSSDTALHNKNVTPSDSVPQVTASAILDIGVVGFGITASVPVVFESISLVILAYSGSGNFIGKFFTPNTTTQFNINHVFNVQQISSRVNTLQWQKGLDYVLAATDSEVFKVPLDECYSTSTCSSCITLENPLCGWCVVENKCSRQSQCRDGNSTRSTRWIPSSGRLANVSFKCIAITISPTHIDLQDLHIFNVTVGGPGLPTKLENESYFCHFKDSTGRFNISVPAVEINPLTQYSCNITNRVPTLDGAKAVLHFSLSSSLFNVGFVRMENATVILRCNSFNRCSGCVETGNVCGWCVVNKVCREKAQDCSNANNFFQLDRATSFQQVCPLLDLKDGTTQYTQHVRSRPVLYLKTRNLPNVVPGYSYMCRIGNRIFTAARINETLLSCQIGNRDLTLTSGGGVEEYEVRIIWNSPTVNNYSIETIGSPRVALYDCRILGGNCSSCIRNRITLGVDCGWCDDPVGTCFIPEECGGLNNTVNSVCPALRPPTILRLFPFSGPPNGGTVIYIYGMNLGMTPGDFFIPGSNITIGGVLCTPLMVGYSPGERILCRTGSGMSEGVQEVVVNLIRNSSRTVATARFSGFMVVVPTVSSVEPAFGPIAGGSRLTIQGTALNSGVSMEVFIAGLECRDLERSPNMVSCTSSMASSPPPSPVPLELRIDNLTIFSGQVRFQYRNNPTFSSINPNTTIQSGGITIFFIGENLDVSRNPQLTANRKTISCSNVNNTHLSCITPPLPVQDTVMYLLRLDNAPPPDFNATNLQLSVREDPTGIILATPSVTGGSNDLTLLLYGQNLGLVRKEEIRVFIAGKSCNDIRSLRENQISCQVPADLGPGINTAVVIVRIGRNLNYTVTRRITYSPINEGSFDFSLLPAVVVPVVVCVVVGVVLSVVSVFAFVKRNKMDSDRVFPFKETDSSNQVVI